MTTLSWADAHFSAAHRDARGQIHGHTWRVRAYWPDDGGDGRVKQSSLWGAVSAWDHAVVPDEYTRAEAMARRIGEITGAVTVDVWRELEGLGARWTR